MDMHHVSFDLRDVWIMAKDRGLVLEIQVGLPKYHSCQAAFAGSGSCWTHQRRPQALAYWLFDLVTDTVKPQQIEHRNEFCKLYK